VIINTIVKGAGGVRVILNLSLPLLNTYINNLDYKDKKK